MTDSPPFDEDGDLPPGVHRLSRAATAEHFGDRGPQRARVSEHLEQILDLVADLTDVERVIIFGSYATAKGAPGDVDLLLIVAGDFEPIQAPAPARVLFDHARAEAELGAHIFWLRNSLGRTLIEQFLEVYGTNRDGKARGVIQIDR